MNAADRIHKRWKGHGSCQKAELIVRLAKGFKSYGSLKKYTVKAQEEEEEEYLHCMKERKIVI